MLIFFFEKVMKSSILKFFIFIGIVSFVLSMLAWIAFPKNYFIVLPLVIIISVTLGLRIFLNGNKNGNKICRKKT
jgi:hypothetical protein